MKVMALREALIKAKEWDEVVLRLDNGSEVKIESADRFPSLLLLKTKESLGDIKESDWVDSATNEELRDKIEELERIIDDLENDS